MKKEIQYFVYVLLLGAGLVAYAHANFPTKDILHMIVERLDRIENKVDNIKIK